MDARVKTKRVTVLERPDADWIARTYGPDIYRFAYWMTGSREDAEDVCQECFLRVMRSADRQTSCANLKAWVFGVARHARKDLERSRIRTERRELQASPPEAEQGPALNAESEELRRVVRGAIQRLGEIYREVVTLHSLEGMSYEDVAAIIEEPVGTVKSRHNYAMSRLREDIGPLIERTP